MEEGPTINWHSTPVLIDRTSLSGNTLAARLASCLYFPPSNSLFVGLKSMHGRMVLLRSPLHAGWTKGRILSLRFYIAGHFMFVFSLLKNTKHATVWLEFCVMLCVFFIYTP